MKILLVQTGFLGDVVLSTAVFPNLKSIYPDSSISVLTTPLAADLVRYHRDVSDVIVFDKRGGHRGISGLLQMAGRLRDEGFSIVFSLHKSWRTAALLWLSRIPKRYAFTAASGQTLYTRTSRREDLAHEVLRNLAVFRNIDLEPGELNQQLHIEVPDSAAQEASRLLGGADCELLVGLAPGSVWPTKCWTVEGFAQVAEELSEMGYRVVLLGGLDDRAVGDAIVESSSAQMIDLIGQTSLLVSTAVIRRLKLLISNDSAPLHLASASGTPIVGVFCATVESFGYGPWQVESECVGVDGLACRPCGLHGGKTCPVGTYACQKNLNWEVVLSAAKRVLGRLQDAT